MTTPEGTNDAPSMIEHVDWVIQNAPDTLPGRTPEGDGVPFGVYSEEDLPKWASSSHEAVLFKGWTQSGDAFAVRWLRPRKAAPARQSSDPPAPLPVIDLGG